MGGLGGLLSLTSPLEISALNWVVLLLLLLLLSLFFFNLPFAHLYLLKMEVKLSYSAQVVQVISSP